MAATEADDDYENLIQTLFTQSFPDSWRENPDFAAYLAELCSSGVERLGREPDRLAEERDQVLEQTQDLAFHNYKTFIKTAECSREIFQDFISVENHVESLLEKLPEFSETCKQFMNAAQEINSSRRLNSLTLARHTQLLEILEIPQVSHFLELLEKDLTSGVGGRLDSLLGQCMYFGLSFSRVGADFRGLLPPLFQSASLKVYVVAVRDATKLFESVMSSYTLQTPPSVLTSAVMSTAIQRTDEPKNLTPPFSLLDHPPLAAYTNALLSAFNELRHCAPLALVRPIRDELHASLSAVVESTCTFHRIEAAALNEKERTLFTSFAKTIVKDLVPFVDRCLAAVFPPNAITIIAGSSYGSDEPGRSLGLNIRDITSPLLPMIPQESDDDKQHIAEDKQIINDRHKNLTIEDRKEERPSYDGNTVDQQDHGDVKIDEK
ncbi:hypothetical protein QZH41_013924 [Actinostola sp. cb2023]|nr:hypothetical protein QZH41_013924 [Actinostola sp. cb2023]